MPETTPADEAETFVDLPAAKAGAAPAKGGVPPEWLETPEEEADELARLIAAGHRGGSVVGAFTFIGVALMIAAFVVYYFDRLPGQDRFSDRLAPRLAAQTEQDYAAYRAGGAVSPTVPTWPIVAHERARQDAFLAAGLALLLGFVFLRIERAKLRRQDLLVYRALAREVEKLRARAAALEERQRQRPA